MKKIICSFLILICLGAYTSCNNEYHADGIDNYATISGSFEIDKYLFPCEGFIEKFEYLEADYHHKQKILKYEKSIAYFKYSPDVYDQALNFVNDEMTFLPDVTFDVNGYTFLQRDTSTLYSSTDKYPVDFPTWFWMMFYSEERNVIGFIGYYGLPETQKIRVDEDFEGFLNYEFASYDWSK